MITSASHFSKEALKCAALIIVLTLVVLANIYNTERAVAATDSCVFIASAQIVSPGSFYNVGDMLDPGYGTLCSPGDNYGFRLQVASVDSGGGVTAVTIVPGGIGYSNPPNNPVFFGGSGSGTGFKANCTFQ